MRSLASVAVVVLFVASVSFAVAANVAVLLGRDSTSLGLLGADTLLVWVALAVWLAFDEGD